MAVTVQATGSTRETELTQRPGLNCSVAVAVAAQATGSTRETESIQEPGPVRLVLVEAQATESNPEVDLTQRPRLASGVMDGARAIALTQVAGSMPDPW